MGRPLMQIPGFALTIAAILYAYTAATHLVSDRACVTFHWSLTGSCHVDQLYDHFGWPDIKSQLPRTNPHPRDALRHALRVICYHFSVRRCTKRATLSASCTSFIPNIDCSLTVLQTKSIK